jgi:hypothetical protein
MSVGLKKRTKNRIFRCTTFDGWQEEGREQMWVQDRVAAPDANVGALHTEFAFNGRYLDRVGGVLPKILVELRTESPSGMLLHRDYGQAVDDAVRCARGWAMWLSPYDLRRSTAKLSADPRARRPQLAQLRPSGGVVHKWDDRRLSTRWSG